jgi:hypothetical protein
MGNDHYCGPLPRGGELERFYTALKVESPEELLLIPIHVDDHLVAIALIDGGPSGHIQGDIAEFLKAFRLFGTGVSIVTMRKRLRDKVLVGAHTR